MTARRRTPILVLAMMLGCWPICDCSPAQASFTPFQLASAYPALGLRGGLQAEYAYEPAISADGAYVAFTGAIASQPGVYRKALPTKEGALSPGEGALELVAPGAGAGAPSISANGQYVSFTTSENPRTGEPTPDGCTQVYVRNMDEAASAQGAYRIASALNGSEEPLTYEGSNSCPGGGSASAGRVALSANGDEVAFTVIDRSNLTGPCSTTTVPPQPPQTSCPTPPEQIAVRNLETKDTTLVSVTRASLGGPPQPVPSGATLSGAPLLGGVPRKGGGNVELGQAASTAAISADGGTVAWMGIDIAEQAPATNLTNLKFVDEYAEPLWRRIADGPGAPTRRVLAGDEQSCPPTCPGGLDLSWDEFLDTAIYAGKGPATGSYISDAESGFTGISAVTPQLSQDGSRVAILSTQPSYEQLPDFGGQKDLREQAPTANAFVVNMTPDLTAEQAITRLTEWGSPDFSDSNLDGPIGQIAISADGTRVAFTTERVTFPLAPPVLITPPVNQAETSQLYEANLKAGTLALVSQGYNGEPANHERGLGGVFSATLSEDGKVLALASGSTNLAFGAVNEGSDVFVTKEVDSPAVAGQQSVTPLPPGPADDPSWSISATASPGPNGALLIDVSVPGAGRLVASAGASVPTTVVLRSRSAKRAASRATRAARARTVTVIETRQVAHAASTAKSEGLLQLRLTPSSHYRSLANGKNGLYATIRVAFVAPGHRRLMQTLQASFPHVPIHRVFSKRKPSKHRKTRA
jgi:WD40-like Beta Propeller Repeat